jgi:hypothetical protein
MRKKKQTREDAPPVYLRCFVDERAIWERQAEIDGARTFMDWVRDQLNKGSREARAEAREREGKR